MRCHPLASNAAALPLLTLLLLLLPHLCYGESQAPPLVSPSPDPPFTPLPPIDPSRTAFVSILYSHPNTDDAIAYKYTQSSVEGIRVMMASLIDPEKGNTKRDRVVLIPQDTDAETRALLTGDGLELMEMDERLPHHDRCAPKFDRIYLWSASLAAKYDRVVYLDWDVLVQRPMEELFLCGEFCMVFNSLMHFVDGLMVVRPDPQVFESMLHAYLSLREQHAKKSFKILPHTSLHPHPDLLPGWLQMSETACAEHSYVFFLNWFGNMEAAPLFNPHYGQSPLRLQRLTASNQLNAMMWYEKYSWTLMRGKDYRNMTDPQAIPALSLGFTTLKPFHWFPGLFFNLGWYWSDQRDKYLGRSHAWFVMSRLLFAAIALLLASKGLKALITWLYRKRPVSARQHLRGKLLHAIQSIHLKLLGPIGGFNVRSAEVSQLHSDELEYVAPTIVSLPGYWLPRIGSNVMGIIFGAVHTFALGYWLTTNRWLIPMLTSPNAAWQLWLLFHVIGVYAFNHWIYLAYHAAPPLLPTASVESAAAAAAEKGGLHTGDSPLSPLDGSRTIALAQPLPAIPPPPFPRSSMVWLCFWEFFIYFMMHRTFYPEFVVKMVVLFPLLATILIAAINVNRRVWSGIEWRRNAEIKMAKGQQVTGSGDKAPLLPGGDRK